MLELMVLVETLVHLPDIIRVGKYYTLKFRPVVGRIDSALKEK